ERVRAQGPSGGRVRERRGRVHGAAAAAEWGRRLG
ncbi:MAG: hypothetical protein AVDCRST_MAG12-2746, partial [uncultured Rubrobacteraceae bacterium]